MRDDLFHVTISSALAQLRRAMVFHHAPSAPGRARVGRRTGRLPEGSAARRPDLDGSRSLTELHLRVLGVGQPPDRAER